MSAAAEDNTQRDTHFELEPSPSSHGGSARELELLEQLVPTRPLLVSATLSEDHTRIRIVNANHEEFFVQVRLTPVGKGSCDAFCRNALILIRHARQPPEVLRLPGGGEIRHHFALCDITLTVTGPKGKVTETYYGHELNPLYHDLQRINTRLFHIAAAKQR